MQDEDLLRQLDLFEPGRQEGLRAARRPAGADLVVELTVPPQHRCHFPSLAGFWLAALWRFLDDSRQSTAAFEGLALQALARPLGASEFAEAYQAVREKLSLMPPQPLELRTAYRLLQGRITSFAGETTDGELWAGFHQAGVYEIGAEKG